MLVRLIILLVVMFTLEVRSEVKEINQINRAVKIFKVKKVMKSYVAGVGFILRDNIVVTNKHICVLKNIKVIHKQIGYEIKTKVYSKSYDLCLIYLHKKLDFGMIKYSTNISLGLDIFYVGYPNFSFTVGSGKIIEYTYDKGLQTFDIGTNAIGGGGSSGSAVYNIKGELVGVVYAATGINHRMSFIPTEHLLNFINNKIKCKDFCFVKDVK